MDITGASAILTGGASGLGAATVKRLAEKGARVVIFDLEKQTARGKSLADEVGGVFCAVDVTSTDDIIAGVDTAKEIAPLRVLVNCAGIGWAGRTIGKDGQCESAFNIDMFKLVMSINLVGTFDCIRLAATAMSQTEPLADGERGSIVNTASVAPSTARSVSARTRRPRAVSST